MKKLLMAAVFLCAIFVSHGQKQQTDSKTLEVNFTPFGNSPVSLNSLKFRKFSSDYSAIRLGLWISSDSDRDVIANTGSLGDDNNSNPTLNRKNSEFQLSLSPGIEQHFEGTNRLSPYVGAELNINFSSASTTTEYWSEGLLQNLGNPVDFNAPFAGYVGWEQKTKDGSFGLGAGGFAGMDFYFADNIYLGAEFGYGIMFNSLSDTKYSSSNDIAWAVSAFDPFSNEFDPSITEFGNGEITFVEENGVQTNEIQSVTPRSNVENGSQFSIGPNWNGALRLGFIF